MKGVEMQIDWRTIQMFLDENGVYEVEVDVDNNKKVRCSCSTFKLSARCKHVKFVRTQMDAGEGHYSIQIPVDISDEEAHLAMSSAELFRNFIIKYGKVEVID